MKKYKFHFSIYLILQTIIFSQNITMVDPSNNIGIDKWGIVNDGVMGGISQSNICLLYTSPSPRDKRQSRMPSSA